MVFFVECAVCVRVCQCVLAVDLRMRRDECDKVTSETKLSKTPEGKVVWRCLELRKGEIETINLMDESNG